MILQEKKIKKVIIDKFSWKNDKENLLAMYSELKNER